MSKKEIYESQILPLLKQIDAICLEHKIPYLAAFVKEDETCICAVNEEGWGYVPPFIMSAMRTLADGPNAAPVSSLSDLLRKLGMQIPGAPCECPECVAERKAQAEIKTAAPGKILVGDASC